MKLTLCIHFQMFSVVYIVSWSWLFYSIHYTSGVVGICRFSQEEEIIFRARSDGCEQNRSQEDEIRVCIHLF
jgi:hypothetical protein